MDPQYFFVDLDPGPSVLLNADPVPAAFFNADPDPHCSKVTVKTMELVQIDLFKIFLQLLGTAPY